MAGLPIEIMKMLAEADKANKLPAGTMHSVLMQEVGGNMGAYLDDPEKYHYPKNAQGKRIAGHTGKISTAFGPFGILESTGAKPGYGVTPLKDKTLAEQIRFAGEYLGKRVARAGSLEKGLAGYGEGAPYAQSVLGRIEDAPRYYKGNPLVNGVKYLAQNARMPTREDVTNVMAKLGHGREKGEDVAMGDLVNTYAPSDIPDAPAPEQGNEKAPDYFQELRQLANGHPLREHMAYMASKWGKEAHTPAPEVPEPPSASDRFSAAMERSAESMGRMTEGMVQQAQQNQQPITFGLPNQRRRWERV